MCDQTKSLVLITARQRCLGAKRSTTTTTAKTTWNPSKFLRDVHCQRNSKKGPENSEVTDLSGPPSGCVFLDWARAIHRLKSSPPGWWWHWEVGLWGDQVRKDLLDWNTNPHIRGLRDFHNLQEDSLSPPLSGDRAKWWPFMNQEAGPWQVQNFLSFWSRAFQLLGPWNKLLVLTTPSLS